MNLNKVFIIGRLTKDVELRATPSGQSVASFGVATNRVWTNPSGQRQEEVEYHNVVVWGRQAELANQYLGKGRLAMIEGRLRTRSWESQAGEKKFRTEIVAERIQFGPRSQSQEKLELQGSDKTQEVPAISLDEETHPETNPAPQTGEQAGFEEETPF